MIHWKHITNQCYHQERFIKWIEIMPETTYSFKAIGDVIYNKMLEIKDNDERIWAVYNHDIKIENWISLPAIIITPSRWNINLLDTCSYENEINYTVRLIDRTERNYSDIEDNMRVVADMVIKKLKEIWAITRSNNNWITVKCTFNYQRWFTDTQEPIRVFEVECLFTAIEQ